MEATIPSVLAGECQKIVRFARARHRENASKISRYNRAVMAVISSLSVSLRCTRQRIENFNESFNENFKES